MNPYNQQYGQQPPPYGSPQMQPQQQYGQGPNQPPYGSPQMQQPQQQYGSPQMQQPYGQQQFSQPQQYGSPQMQPQQFGQPQFNQPQQQYGSPQMQPQQQFGQQTWMTQQFAGPSQFVDFNQLKQAFDAWDKNGDGKIEPHELEKAMHHLGENVSREDVNMIMGMFDKDHNGYIDFSEFQQLFTYVNELKQEFNNADVNKSGFLDVEQVKQALHKHHKALILAGGAATIYGLFKLHDMHKRGKLQWNDFLKMSLHLGSLRSNFENQQGFGQQQLPQYGQQGYGGYPQKHHHEGLFEGFANWAETHLRR